MFLPLIFDVLSFLTSDLLSICGESHAIYFEIKRQAIPIFLNKD
jgi:hypothetical protein